MTRTAQEPSATPGADPPELQRISGGHLVAKALKAEGVDTTFTLCGGHLIDIHDGRVDEGISVIDVRHEQVAGQAPWGYARGTGRPGDHRYERSAEIPGGYGETVRDPDTGPAPLRARDSGKPSLTNVWVVPGVYVPGTMNQMMYE